ncbi:collagen binding domain-containing protein [Paenibacillus sp. D2_2]|uniref:collagen binding domain-containing protein n=1 Tax=Paenibacillus sp. D2_2 TaxID=3073092 RepID=UPI0028150C34|nr:collagen binding domain-containing protein [Paenibacillus sp. D2_2]WMT41385.1 collagen binding domain-containing protein [Paenibacillus sp. D2_2]
MKIFKKPIFLFLAIILMLNIVLPSSITFAEGETEDAVVSTQESVTDDVYGDIKPLNAVGEITENIITSIEMYDQESKLVNGVLTNTGNKISEIRPAQDASVEVDFTWELPAGHGYEAGSTFTFNLPKNLKVPKEMKGNLGGYGTVVVTVDGQVTFTFDENIEDTPVTNGYFGVWVQFNKGSFNGGTHQDIDFIIHGDKTTIPVHFQSSSDSEIDKTCKANKGMNASRIDWAVEFNKGEKKIENAVFEDTLPTGLKIDLTSIKVYQLEVQLNGTVKNSGEITSGFTKQSTSDGFEIKFAGSIDGAYRVTYSTDIIGTEDKTFSNNVTVSGDNLTELQKTLKDVNVTYSKPLEKDAIGYDPKTQTIKWEIRYNYNEQKIKKADAYLNDTFDAVQELIPGSFEVTKMKINDNGSASENGNFTNYLVDDSIQNGFKLNFNEDIDSAYKIVYKTKSKERVYGNSSIKNTVTYNGESKTANQNIGQVIFHKYDGAVNFNAKKITWSMTLNEDEYEMKNAVITDSFVTGQGLTFEESSLEISGLEKERTIL